MIDTHCHITNSDYDDIPFLIDKIKKSGVKKIIVNGTDMKSNLEVLELIKKYDIVYGALGFHPTELDNYTDDDLKWALKYANSPRFANHVGIILTHSYILGNGKRLEKETIRLTSSGEIEITAGIGYKDGSYEKITKRINVK